MLTDSEKAWLKRRQFCNGFYTAICDRADYLLHPDLEDALEFSERVAEKLADPYFPPMDVGSDGPQLLMPPADRLKWARIEVEKEVDAENG